jgi:hypothetical protein
MLRHAIGKTYPRKVRRCARSARIREAPEVPDILKMGHRGANIKVLTFLRLNPDQWFTARAVSGYLEMPLSTAQLALRRLVGVTHRIQMEDISIDQRGRREKRYRFQRLFNKIYVNTNV